MEILEETISPTAHTVEAEGLVGGVTFTLRS